MVPNSWQITNWAKLMINSLTKVFFFSECWGMESLYSYIYKFVYLQVYIYTPSFALFWCYLILANLANTKNRHIIHFQSTFTTFVQILDTHRRTHTQIHNFPVIIILLFNVINQKNLTIRFWEKITEPIWDRFWPVLPQFQGMRTFDYWSEKSCISSEKNKIIG